jgi:hypothetical protein
VMLTFPDGINLSTGLTIVSETTSDGSTGSSAADRSNGFVIIGAP